MAGDRVNNYSQVDSNILELQLTTDKTFKGYHQLTLTNYDNTTVPAIAAGSAIECNGALYKFDSEEAISTTDPVTSATVADGTVYVCIVPGTTTCTAAFTATAPTWSDSKQGWYGTGGQANYRYCEYIIIKSTSSYIKLGLKNKLTGIIPDHIKIYLSADQSISGTSVTQIKFNSKEYDVNNSFNTTNYTFTAKETGFYHVSTSCSFSSIDGAGTYSILIYLNNSLYRQLARGYSASNEAICVGGALTLLLNKDDYLEFYADANYGTSYHVNDETFVCIDKIF